MCGRCWLHMLVDACLCGAAVFGCEPNLVIDAYQHYLTLVLLGFAREFVCLPEITQHKQCERNSHHILWLVLVSTASHCCRSWFRVLHDQCDAPLDWTWGTLGWMWWDDIENVWWSSYPLSVGFDFDCELASGLYYCTWVYLMHRGWLITCDCMIWLIACDCIEWHCSLIDCLTPCVWLIDCHSLIDWLTQQGWFIVTTWLLT